MPWLHADQYTRRADFAVVALARCAHWPPPSVQPSLGTPQMSALDNALMVADSNAPATLQYSFSAGAPKPCKNTLQNSLLEPNTWINYFQHMDGSSPKDFANKQLGNGWRNVMQTVRNWKLDPIHLRLHPCHRHIYIYIYWKNKKNIKLLTHCKVFKTIPKQGVSGSGHEFATLSR